MVNHEQRKGSGAMTSPSTVTATEASEPGALEGFGFTCDICGQTFKSSQRTLAEQDAEAHAVWHDKRGGR